MDLYLDTETFGEEPIKNGAHRYAEKSEILLVALAKDSGPVSVWDCTNPDNTGWQQTLQDLIDEADRVVIHNSAFDRTVLRHHGVTIPVEKIVDTMVLALQHGLPGSLGQLCDVLGVEQDKAKDKDGKKLIQLFTKPRPKNMKLRRATRETHPDEWQRFIEYARLDVDAMRSVYRRTPRWNDLESERSLWRIDQDTNDSGIAVDLELAQSALAAFGRASGSLAALTAELTGGLVTATTQRNKLIAYLRENHDFVTADMTKGSVDFFLRDGSIKSEVRKLLEIRQQAAATSPSKYKALLGAVSSDGRLRGTLQFCGAARTGRDAGRIFQPQNLPRTPDWFDEDVQEITISAIKANCEDLIWANVSERCSMSVRGCLLAGAGKKLSIADLSNIEGRVLAWGAGEQWKLEAFKQYDLGLGQDLYKVTAGRILGKDAVDVTKDERQSMGKVPELACGYQGGVGAFRTMGGQVVEGMDDATIQDIVKGWRKAHPRTVAFWYDLERACKAAIRSPGDSFAVRDMAVFDVMPDQTGRQWLRMKLPSGRYLCYPDPAVEQEICERCDGDGEIPFVHEGVERIMKCPHCGGSGTQGWEQIYYSGVNQYTRKWARISTYGGKLAENWTQAVARDVFFSGMKRAYNAGYRIVLRVHDELVTEVPIDGELSWQGLAKCMATNPSWTAGLPLNADGFDALRYRK